MRYSYGRNDIKDRKRANSYCYLLSNGLGGYSSATITQSLTRNDHALLMAAINAPSLRFHLVSKVEEIITIDGNEYNLSSQDYVDYSKNQQGEQYLVNMVQEYLPTWNYLVDGVEIKKTQVMEHEKNNVGMLYEIDSHGDRAITLTIIPCVQFVEKGLLLQEHQIFEFNDDCIKSNEITLNIHAPNARVENYPTTFVKDLYYEYDARDGRFAYGCYAKGNHYHYNMNHKKQAEICFYMEEECVCVSSMIEKEIQRQQAFIKKSDAKSDITKTLVRAADQFIVRRDSINSMTLMAGYPFFTDWGRDTMYALEGCCISTKRFEESKAILRTFVKYEKNGIMPNLFPEGDKAPQYNTVDASLLFFQTLKAYLDACDDIEFMEEMFPTMKNIITSYKNGTDFDIKMDSDGLIQAGSGINQLTWMDIRYENILPTPRHGKPVEVNALWYNALCTISEFGEKLDYDVQEYQELAKLVKASFQKQFWNDERKCLYDVISSNVKDSQLRCNQVWAVSVPYSPLDNKQAKQVVETLFHYLYTPYGLRTLDEKDTQFASEYSGSLKKRDLSYHQGTVWTFPLGSYFRAYLKVHDYDENSKHVVLRQLSYFEDCVREGCIGQIAEIYDGLDPAQSKGCFGQGWSVGEILKILLELEQ